MKQKYDISKVDYGKYELWKVFHKDKFIIVKYCQMFQICLN